MGLFLSLSRGQKTRLQNTKVLEHNFNNRELHTQHILLTTQQDRIGVSSLANKLHLASKNLQKTHLITVATGFGNTRAAKTHHTMRNSRRLARYKAHGFFLATHDTESAHWACWEYKLQNWNGTGLGKTKLFSCWGLALTVTEHFKLSVEF